MGNNRVLYVKNMVCDRCVMVVHRLCTECGIAVRSVELGMIRTVEQVDDRRLSLLRTALHGMGFELIDDRRERIVERIKNEIVKLVYRDNGGLKENLSDYLARTVGYDYGVLSKLFSEVVGTTIERCFIAQKIERVKELLVYGELSLSQIADMMNYSSVAHLSAQFKRVTGMTPTAFKQNGGEGRFPLDRVWALPEGRTIGNKGDEENM